MSYEFNAAFRPNSARILIALRQTAESTGFLINNCDRRTQSAGGPRAWPGQHGGRQDGANGERVMACGEVDLRPVGLHPVDPFHAVKASSRMSRPDGQSPGEQQRQDFRADALAPA
jgi:hypothetical protein